MKCGRFGSLESIMRQKCYCTEVVFREIVSCCLLGMDYLQRKNLTCVGSVSSSECVVDQAGQPVSVR